MEPKLGLERVTDAELRNPERRQLLKALLAIPPAAALFSLAQPIHAQESDNISLVAPNCPPIVSDFDVDKDMDGKDRKSRHEGVDILEAGGYPVIAAADGKVVVADYEHQKGNRVILYHGEIRGKHIFTTYGHLSEYVIPKGKEARGIELKRGDLIAKIGATGSRMPDSRTPHLHFIVTTSPTGKYRIIFGLASISGMEDVNPRPYWLLDSNGKIQHFIQGEKYLGDGLTYPVPCKR